MTAEFLCPNLLLQNIKEDSSTVAATQAQSTIEDSGKVVLHEVVHVTPLLLLAIELGFTNEGEIFSSKDLGVLGERHYGLRVEVLRPFSSIDIVKHLFSGFPIIIPFDADKNYAPCASGGKHAHWAVVRGFVYKKTQNEHDGASELFEKDSSYPSWFYTAQSSNSIRAINHDYFVFDPYQDTIPVPFEDEHLYLICQHGKSRNIALWSYASLFDSNHSLAAPDTTKQESGRWKIPNDLEGLQGSIVLVFPP